MVKKEEQKLAALDLDVLELTRRLKREPNIPTAINILTWELGDLAKCQTYGKWFPNLAMSYREESRIALSAIVFQSAVIAELLGTNLREMMEMGIDSVKERAIDIEHKVGRYQEYVGEPKHE